MEPDLAPQDTGSPATSAAGAPLNGTLEDNTPAGVLQVLSSQQETGAVRFSGESGCTVYLHEGELYFAETADTGEDLAVALVRPGRLTADEWDQSTATGYPTETVGEALIDTGSISRELLASVVLSVIYDPLIQLFRSPEGDFEFEPGIVHWIGPYRTFSVDAVVAEVRRRTREADEMAPIIPNLDAWVQTTRTLPNDRGNVNLRRDDWEVVIAAAAGRTVSELAVDLGRGRWSTARLVYRLASVDLLSVAGASTSSPLTTAAPAPADDFDFSSNAPAPADAGFNSSPDAFEPATTIEDHAPSLVDGPPPLDPAAFEPADATDVPAATSWDEPSWDSTSWDPTTETDTAPTAPSPVEDSGWGEAPAPAADAASPDTETTWGDSSANGNWDSAFQDVASDAAPPLDASADAPPIAFEPPALHPDIAKALAESTYADSATAINAMAARLGAADAGDDDDWDDASTEPASAGDEASAFWANDTEEKAFPWDDQGGATPNGEFTWQPAAWDVGVETTPLPQREHVPADPNAEPTGPAGSSDPQWLENLYSQFMPTGDGQQPAGRSAPNSVEMAFGADPGAAPKAKTLRRLMSAIKRL